MLSKFLKNEWEQQDGFDGRNIIARMKQSKVNVQHVRAFDPGTKNVGDGIFLVGDIRNPYNLGIYIANRHNIYLGYRTTVKLPNGNEMDIAPWTRTEVKAMEWISSLKGLLKEADVCLVERQMKKPESNTSDVINVGAQLLSAGVCLTPYTIRNDPHDVACHFSYLFPEMLEYRDRRGRATSKCLKENASYEDGRKFNKLCAVVAARDQGMLSAQEMKVINERLLLIELEAKQAHETRLACFKSLSQNKSASSISSILGDFDQTETSLKIYDIKQEEDDFIDPILDCADLLRQLYDVDILERRLSAFRARRTIRYLLFLKEDGIMDQDWRLHEPSNELRCVIVLVDGMELTKAFFSSNFECDCYITNIFNYPSYALYCHGKKIDWIDDITPISKDRQQFMDSLHQSFPSTPSVFLKSKEIPIKKKILKDKNINK